MTAPFRHRGIEEPDIERDVELWAARMEYEESRKLARSERNGSVCVACLEPVAAHRRWCSESCRQAEELDVPYSDVELEREHDWREREAWERDEESYNRVRGRR